MARRPKAAEPPAEIAEYEPPAAGHNRPPESIGPDLSNDDEEWEARLNYLFKQCDTRLDELLAADARFKDGFPLTGGKDTAGKLIGIEKWDDEVQARAATLRQRWNELVKAIDNIHEAEKAAVLRAGRAIDGARNRRISKIGHYDSKKKLIRGADAPLNRIQDRCTVYALWVDQEKQRLQREEAERLRIAAEVAAEAAAQTSDPEAFDQAADAFAQAEDMAKQAEARPADRTRVHGLGGAVMSLRGRFTFIEAESDIKRLAMAVVNGQADAKYLAFNTVAINRAITSEEVRAIPGCVIREDLKV
jgi:hypothetical protein